MAMVASAREQTGEDETHGAALPTGRGLALVRLAAWGLVLVMLLGVQAAWHGVSPKSAWRVPMLFHRISAWIFGFRIAIHGRIADHGPTLFVSNHSSYLDITILGTMLRTSFIAKAEVADWPLFGTLARLQRSVFVDRRPANAASHISEVEERLSAGENLVLFAEGTSSDGNRVLPFRSSLFAVAGADSGVKVQPVTIAWTRLNGMPMGRMWRPLVAWYGDMDVPDHLLAMAGAGRFGVDVIFHEPVSVNDFASRKELAMECEARVAAGLEAAFAGRASLAETVAQ